MCLNKQKKLKDLDMKIKYMLYFILSTTNVTLVTEKKTPLPKIMNIKTKFTKILSCQEANDRIEINSD